MTSPNSAGTSAEEITERSNAIKQGASVAQRRAASPESSVWVAASAGTGKTKVLTDRVLSLLLEGTAPPRILCLTFTKAAAAEMSNRLAQRLARWATLGEQALVGELQSLTGLAPDGALIETARQLFARVLDAPGGMKILTIHSFCQSLLGRFPLEAGVAPHFQVLDDRSAEELLLQAREGILSRAGRAPDSPLGLALTEIATHAQEQSFSDLIAELIMARGRLTQALQRHGGLEGLIAAIFACLGVEQHETVEDLLERALEDVALDLIGLRLACDAFSAGSKTDVVKGEVLARWLAGNLEDRIAGFNDYASIFTTKKREVAKRLLTKAAAAAVPSALPVLEVEAQRILNVQKRLDALAVAKKSVALLRLGAEMLGRYADLKSNRALLDYDDLIFRTRELLQRPDVAPWVLFKLDGGLDHILVDEAQDTNPDQWAVVRHLADEFFSGESAREDRRTLFVVGDAKQSIYSFQRADPAVFEAMRAYFAERVHQAGQSWDEVGLGVSFRSTSAVLSSVDEVFAQPEAFDGVRFGEELIEHLPARLGQGGIVEVWPPVDPQEEDAPEPWELPVAGQRIDSPRSRLARLIANKIHYWTQSDAGANDPEAWLASKNRRMDPGDLLVLVRRRNDFVEELVRELKTLQVPVAGVDRMVLTNQLAVMDLIALGRVLLLPEDSLTLATVLKGPLIALEEDQLFDLAHGRSGSLWMELCRYAQEHPAFQAAYTMIAALLERAEVVRPFELFAEVLGPRGGRQALVARLGPDANDPIDEFLNLALSYEREQTPTLEGFLHWLERGEQEIKRDMEHGGGAVRVMTVHGSKGLQAPVVFLPDTLQGPLPHRGLIWLKSDGDLPIWSLGQDFAGLAESTARRAISQASTREYKRLLYVAMTRAEDRLLLCGWNDKRRTPPDDCWYNLVQSGIAPLADEIEYDFSTSIADGWSGTGWRLEWPQIADSEAAGSFPEAQRGTARLPAWAGAKPPAEPSPPRPLAPSRPSGPEPAVRSPLGGDRGQRFRRGRLIHRLLQTLPELAFERREEAGRRFLARPLHDLTEAQQIEILDETLAVIEDSRFGALFGPGSQAEVPVVGVVPQRRDSSLFRGAEVISGQVDRLLVTDNKVWIIDYKTNRPAPLDPEAVPAIYLKQMASYRSVLRQIYPDKQIETLLLWTDGPRLMHLSDALIADHAP
ncbi:double-strand break repair helicase AddA [Pelagibius sp. Alg239-R121]|uniref:double-strand break repair helicase AddA n=1 Tax=Pelagibius sp. Alg239-R121 TaxID=2993448 RepID=UPI0024A6A5A9|nr:double-strand break repair helicase AddA [Pelagibius sp. Alg239-R121]